MTFMAQLADTPSRRQPVTETQYAALKWLCEHGYDGAFDRHDELIAGSDRAPFWRKTWNGLMTLGYVEDYPCKGKVRVRVSARGREIAHAKWPSLVEDRP